MTLTPDRWVRIASTSKPSSCCESRRIYDLNIRDLLAPLSYVDVSHLPLGMRMCKVRGVTLHCFRVEIPACVYRLPPQLALLSCQGCKSEMSDLHRRREVRLCCCCELLIDGSVAETIWFRIIG